MAVSCKSSAILLVSIVVMGIHASPSGVAAFQGSVGLHLAHNVLHHLEYNCNHQGVTVLSPHLGDDNTVLMANLAATATATATATTTATATATATTTTMATAVTNAATTEIELESEVLQDASHFFLDFSVFVTRSKRFLTVAQIVGRLLLLVQDYLPDRHVAPEELGIQVLMMAVCLSKRGNTEAHHSN
jgi:hypothetical protein